MSFGTAQPVTEKKVAGISADELSTNQEGIVVPYFGGSARLSLLWLTPFYNLRSVDVESGGGKKGVEGGTTQKKWYADIAGVANVCPDDAPTDALLYVIVNDDKAFTGPLNRSGGAHYAAFSINSYCQECRIYWGTKDQPRDDLILFPRQASVPPGVDPRNAATWPPLDANGDPWGGPGLPPGVANPYAGHYDFHPAYRNQCYFVFRQFFLGNSPNMPNVEVALIRGCKFFGGTRLEASATGVNPMGPLYEVFTDDMFGAGIPISSLDQTSWQATADALDDQGIKLGPKLNEPKSIRAWAAGYMENYDGFLRRKGNVIEAGYFDHGDLDTTTCPELDSDDVAEGEPVINPVTDSDLKTHFDILYTNRNKWWKADTASFKHPENIQKFQEVRPDRSERPDIIDAALAQRYVIERGLMLGKAGGGSGSTKFLRNNVRDIYPGDRIKLDSASFGLQMLMRVLKKIIAGPLDGPTALQYSVEQADWDHPYIQPPVVVPPGFTIEAFAITHQRIVELPSPLKDRPGIAIAVLAERPSPHILGFRTHVSSDGGTTFNLLANQIWFAVRGIIKVEDYPDDTDVVDESVGMRVELYGLDLATVVSLSDAQRDDYTGLVWIGNEIMSWGTVTALGDGQFRIFGRRGCFGTPQQAHAIDTEVWFVYRLHIMPMGHMSFLPQATDHFKLQTYTFTQNLELADAPDISYFFNDGPFLINNLRIYNQDVGDEVFIGRHPHFQWDLFDIAGLGFAAVPGAAPAVFNSNTGQWHDLTAFGHANENVSLRLNPIGSLTPPVSGAPKIFNSSTGLWHALTATGTGDAMILQIANTGGSTPPTGGTPIVNNAATGLFYRLFAKTVSSEIVMWFDPFAAFSLDDANHANDSPEFLHFIVEVLDPSNGHTVWRHQTVDPEYIFPDDENLFAAGGPFREFIFQVKYVARLMDGSLYVGPWLGMVARNEQSVSPGGYPTAHFDHIHIHYHILPSDPDFVGRIVWRSRDPDFEVTAPLGEGVELVFDGSDNSFDIPQPEGSTYYYKSAAYDAFSPTDHSSQAFLDDIDVSNAVPFTTLTNTPTLAPPALSPGSQNFNLGLDITVIAPAGAVVRYTLDGTHVLPNSQEWPKTGEAPGIGHYVPLHISQSCVLHARYYTPEGTPSQLVTAIYTLEGTGSTCGAVSIEFDGIQGESDGTITLECATPGRTIHYNLNGVGGGDYTAPFPIEINDTVQAFATAPGLADGPISFFSNTPVGGGGGPPPP